MTRVLSLIVIAVLVLSACSFYGDNDDDRSAPTASIPPSATVSATIPPVIVSTAGAARQRTEVPDRTVTPVVAEEVVELAYFHIAPVDGEPPELLAQQASFVTLTRGDEAYRDALRNAGYDGLVLQFLVASEVNGPGPYRDASDQCDDTFEPLRNGIAVGKGQFCSEIQPNEDWFLHNGAGERLYDVVGETGVWYHMNPASQGWRDYARRQIEANLTGPTAMGYDGVFLDNVELSIERVQSQLSSSDGTVAEFANEDAYRQAWITYLSDIADVVRPRGPLWANLVADPRGANSWTPYLQSLDGAMLAAFATGYNGLGATEWADELRRVEGAIDAGKGLVLVGRGEQSDLQLQQFALGSYLLVTDADDTYFRYVQNAEDADYTTFWVYSNYDVRLGQPLGGRYRSGLSWRRDFECGYVLVNPSQRTAEITETPCGVPTPVTP